MIDFVLVLTNHMKSDDSKHDKNVVTAVWKVLQDNMPSEILHFFPKRWLMVICFLLILFAWYLCAWTGSTRVLQDCDSSVNQQLARKQKGSPGDEMGKTLSDNGIDKFFESDINWVFRAKTWGYNFSRIPALVQLNNVFYAFCEGRKDGASDFGEMDIIYRKGYRRGKDVNWSEVRIAAQIAGMRVMNPCPIVDFKRNAIVMVFIALSPEVKEHEMLVMGQHFIQLYVTKTLDGGKTWSTPTDISSSTVDRIHPTPSAFAPGPGHGIQLKSGTLAVAIHYLQKDYNHSHYYSNRDSSGVIYSEDGGKTWTSGTPNPYKEDTYGHLINANEGQVVELKPDVLAINARTLDVMQTRMTAFSIDGGRSFPHVFLSQGLIEPGFKYKSGRSRLTTSKFGGCQGSVLAFPRPKESDLWLHPKAVLFSNPASLFREKMSIRLSPDGCVTWTKPWVIHSGPAAYSDLTYFTFKSPNSNRTVQAFAILFEAGTFYAYEGIKFKFFTLDALLKNLGQNIHETTFLDF